MKKATQLSKLMIIILLSVFMFYSHADADGVKTIGTGTGTEQYTPLDDYWMYSWSEIVYQQSDIGLGSVLINQIAFQVAVPASTTLKQNQQVYMKNVGYSTITSNAYPNPTANGYTLVYSGNVNLLTGWVVITFQAPFVYDGTNLSIVWENRNGAYYYPYTYFYYTSRASSCKYRYQDNSFPTDAGTIGAYQANIQLYWAEIPPATLDGTVTDAYTGLPILGAKVTAGTTVMYTLEDGTYTTPIVPMTYNIIFEKPGYTTQSQYVYVAPGSTTTVDKALWEEAVPPSGVLAALRPPNNNVVDVTWGIPNGYYEVIYDDGTFENMTAWLEEGSLNALKFTPVGYPVNVTGGSVNIGDGTFPPGGDQLQTFGIAVFDDDGPNGYPGTYLGSIEVEPQAFGWVSFDLSSLGITFSSGEFYIGMQQGGNWP
ncbi:MAG: carboxypeptidase-like regulatory domain-containing protein, partial [Bacteroidetes bacterium]|nr:carboxypeptidase-like regulatory domain-containing protein [Bacteroidota bacterium]